MRVSDLANQVAADPALREQISANPETAIRAVALAAPLEQDVWIYRGIIVVLGLTVLLVVGAATYLGARQIPVPDVLIALGPSALAGMAGLLAPRPGGS